MPNIPKEGRWGDIAGLIDDNINDVTLGDPQAGHFIYDPVQDKLIADVPIQTTLESLYLGEQHSMSSGGENVFFKNLTTDISWFPLWAGILDHAFSDNHGVSGTIKPSGRVYSDDMLTFAPAGPEESPLVYTDAQTPPFTVIRSFATLGFNIRPELAVPVGYHIIYNVQRDDYNGITIYRERRRVSTEIPAGAMFEFWLEHPFEIHGGATIAAQLLVEDLNGDLTPWSLSKLASSELTYSAIHFRTFVDEEIILRSSIRVDVGQTEWIMGTLLNDSIHDTDGQIICWPDTVAGAEALGDYIDWFVPTPPP